MDVDVSVVVTVLVVVVSLRERLRGVVDIMYVCGYVCTRCIYV